MFFFGLVKRLRQTAHGKSLTMGELKHYFKGQLLFHLIYLSVNNLLVFNTEKQRFCSPVNNVVSFVMCLCPYRFRPLMYFFGKFGSTNTRLGNN